MNETNQAETQKLTREELEEIKQEIATWMNHAADIDSRIAGKRILEFAPRLLAAAERDCDYLGKMAKMNMDLREVIKDADLKSQQTLGLLRGCVGADTNEQLEELYISAHAQRSNYNELIMEVARKFPGETRHETARRYIREAECAALSPAQPQISTQQTDGGGTPPLQNQGGQYE
jgi:hypothetical protein